MRKGIPLNFHIKFFAALLVAVFAYSLPADAEARVKIKQSTSYYNVRGINGIQVAARIITLGPKVGKNRHSIASTSIKLDIKNVKPRVKNGVCSIRSVDVILTLKYRYPRWLDNRRASKRLRRNWKRFYAHVKQHERTHGKIAKEMAYEVERELRSMRGTVRRGCRDISRGAKARFAKIRKKYHAKHNRFDRLEKRANSRNTRLQKALFKTK